MHSMPRTQQCFCLPKHALSVFLVLLSQALHAQGAAYLLNVGGSTIPSIGFYSDNTALLTNQATSPFNSPKIVKVQGTWGAVYGQYRYAYGGNLEYALPVPSSVVEESYSIALLFAETWPDAFKPGVRIFNVLVNGNLVKPRLDVFAIVGSNKAYFLPVPPVKPMDGKLVVTLQRIAGKQNPMLSGLVIVGPSILSALPTSPEASGPESPTVPVPAPTTEPTTPITPVSPTEPPSPSASGSGDPSCAFGIFAENAGGQKACCEKECGKCGGAGCNNFSPGKLCCISSVAQWAPSCTDSGPPCVLSDVAPAPAPPASSEAAPAPAPAPAEPTCAKGVLGWNKSTGQAACCVEACGKCGGANCNAFAPPNLCCISSVVSVGKTCDTNDPPCIPSFGEVEPSSTPITEPSTPTGNVPLMKPGTCPISGGGQDAFRMNTAGGAAASAAMGADNVAYVSSPNKGQVFSVPSNSISGPNGAQEWDVAYSSHRWTSASILAYSIPVPDGTYMVKLLFAETFFNKPNQRTFDIFINGVEKKTNFDVFGTVGKNVGLIVEFPGILAKAGQISINLIKTIENPMISGIFIEGPGAGLKAFGGGCKTLDDSITTPDLNGGFNHRAHSVPGGPYIATDFDKNGFAFVAFDGTQSHSHYSDPGPPEVSGKIVSYKWTWKEDIGGLTVIKSNTDKSGKFTAAFPLGTTKVSLEVVDSTGDVALDSVEVEVKDSTEDGAYCYYFDYDDEFFATVPLSQSTNSEPKPKFGSKASSIDFKSAAEYPSFPFKTSSFAVRCEYFVNVGSGGSLIFKVEHNGPFKLFHAGTLLSQSMSKGSTKSPEKTYPAGLQPFQLVYFRPKNVTPLLSLQLNGAPISGQALQHDSSVTLPVIISLSKSTSTPSGGQNIQIYGSGFINGVSVKFGNVDAQNLISSDPGSLQVTVPPGTGKVYVTVRTNAGVSNQYPFMYVSETTLNQPVIFKKTKLKDQNGGTYKISFVAAATYGPDGRLYLGGIKGQLSALGIDKDHKVTTSCVRDMGSWRAILGVAFNPATNALKMYFTTSTMYWKDDKALTFEEGWTNGKIQAIEYNPQVAEDGDGKKCAWDVTDVVTGLPVSNHDHGINKLAFSQDGNLLVSIGGFTNGGVSVPGAKRQPGDPKDDALGGVSSNPLSAAIVSCPTSQLTEVKYDQYTDPGTAKVVSGKSCILYATGFRNSFGMTVHTNGNLYVTDNGPNAGFGAFSTNCNGGFVSGKNLPDRLYQVEKGKYHGHPNLNRKECEHYPQWAVQPLLKNIKSAATGVLEYRSNTFGGEIKGNLYMTKFSGQNEGQVSQVKLQGSNGANDIGYAANFLGYSGAEVVEGPRGELVMPRVYKFEVVIAQPSYPAPDVTYMIGVHPKRGPSSGGTRVLISGHNFGTAPTAMFGGTPCYDVELIDDESFSCFTPAKGKGQKVAVVVSGAVGESPSYGSDYWYW